MPSGRARLDERELRRAVRPPAAPLARDEHPVLQPVDVHEPAPGRRSRPRPELGEDGVAAIAAAVQALRARLWGDLPAHVAALREVADEFSVGRPDR